MAFSHGCQFENSPAAADGLPALLHILPINALTPQLQRPVAQEGDS